MTAKELLQQMSELQDVCNKKQNKLRRQYAEEHNPVKKGDIITDHYHTIMVEEMRLYGHPVPYMCYYGTELTMKGEPKKHQPVPGNPVHQAYLKSINGEPYKYEKEQL